MADDSGKYEYHGGGEDFNINKVKPNVPTKTPYLDQYGRDLTKLAQQGKLEPVIGREVEINQAVQILNKKKKSNPILVGEPGCGKSSIVEGIAIRIASKQIDRWLFNKRIIELNMMSVVAGTKYRGEFEQRMEEVLKEVKNNTDIILFIDEIHNVIGAGGASGSMDAANLIKPALSRGELKCIGATTLDDFKKYIETDTALERRFQKVYVSIPTKEQTKEILNQIKKHYEDYHGVLYSEEVIDSCVELSDRFITYKNFPDKAIDLLDEVGSKIKLSNVNTPEAIKKLERELKEAEGKKALSAAQQDYESAAKFRDLVNTLKENIAKENDKWMETVKINKVKATVEDVARVISNSTGIPLNKLTDTENVKLLGMEKLMKEKVIGQNDAVIKIVEAVQRGFVGLSDPGKPKSFLFLGPSGTGKTLLAKTLSDYLFDTKDSFIRVDMSEYMDSHSTSKFIGSPPGFVGFDDKGQLTEKVKNNPYCVILLDEIEKAHPDVLNILLQVLDDGILTDSHGKTINFKNAIIIMTSNIGTEKILGKNRLGFGSKDEENNNKHTEDLVLSELKKKCRPEFINRIDEKIVFKPLGEPETLQIVDIEMKSLVERIEAKGYKLNVDLATKKFLATNGFDTEYGARPLKRSITQYIETPVAKFLLVNSSLKTGSTIKVKFVENKKDVDVSASSISNSKKKHE